MVTKDCHAVDVHSCGIFLLSNTQLMLTLISERLTRTFGSKHSASEYYQQLCVAEQVEFHYQKVLYLLPTLGQPVRSRTKSHLML